MAGAIEVSFPESSGLERVRHFAEELGLRLGQGGALPLHEADAEIAVVVVSAVHTRRLGRSKKLIQGLLEKHGMVAEAIIRTFKA